MGPGLTTPEVVGTGLTGIGTTGTTEFDTSGFNPTTLTLNPSGFNPINGGELTDGDNLV